jgi:hypothetical protein
MDKNKCPIFSCPKRPYWQKFLSREINFIVTFLTKSEKVCYDNFSIFWMDITWKTAYYAIVHIQYMHVSLLTWFVMWCIVNTPAGYCWMLVTNANRRVSWNCSRTDLKCLRFTSNRKISSHKLRFILYLFLPKVFKAIARFMLLSLLKICHPNFIAKNVTINAQGVFAGTSIF